MTAVTPDKQTKEYRLNRSTRVIVTSTKDKDAEIYRTKFQLIHETADTKPMMLATREEIQDYLSGEVDLQDDQVALFGGKES